MVGPETRKLREPYRCVCTRGTIRPPWSAERKRERPATEWTGTQMSLKYAGHRPRAQSKTVSAILHSRLDYSNFTSMGYHLTCCDAFSLCSAPRLVLCSGFVASRYDLITNALATLHWLRLPERVEFTVAVMAFRVLHGLAPPYVDQLFRVAITICVCCYIQIDRHCI